jgi:predicted PurR-regulated permease PerM
MTRPRQMFLFWVVTLAILFGCLFLFSSILLPFVAGATIAYLFHPVLTRLEARGVHRGIGAISILLLLAFVLIAVAVLLVPLLVEQLIGLIEGVPQFVARIQELFGSVLESDWARFLGIEPESIRVSLANFMSRGVELFGTLLSSLWTGGQFVVGLVTFMIVAPFAAFFFLRDWPAVIARVDNLLPRDESGDIRRLAAEIDQKISAFIRGQFLSGLALGTFYSIGLVAIGLNYGLLIGLASGIFSFVPYLGFTVGFIVALAVALVQFWPEWQWLLAVVAVFTIGQLIEGYLLQPFLVGKSVGLHPVWLLFALLAFGYLFGFLGLLVAVPAAAAVGVLLDYAINRYRRSDIYTGENHERS